MSNKWHWEKKPGGWTMAMRHPAVVAQLDAMDQVRQYGNPYLMGLMWASQPNQEKPMLALPAPEAAP